MIVCSCNVRSDTELKEEAKKGTPWSEAVLKLPVSNVCGRCKHLCKPMYKQALEEAGYPDEPERGHRSSSADRER